MRHRDSHFGFFVHDQIAGDIDDHIVNRSTNS